MRRLNLENLIKWGLVLFIFTLPLQNRDLFSFFGTRLFPSRLTLIGLIVLSGVYFLKAVVRSGDFFRDVLTALSRLWSDQLLRFLLILWLIRVVSVRESLNLKASTSLVLFFTSMTALYLILRFFRERNYRFFLRLFDLYLVVVVGVGIYGLIQGILSVFGLRLPGVLVGSTFIRVPATFYDANHLPPFLLTGLPLLLVNAFGQRRGKVRFSLYLLATVLSLVVFLTFSRSGVIAFLVVFMIFTFYFIWRRYWRKISFLAAGSLVILLLIYISSRTTFSFVKRISSIVDLSDRSTVAHALLLYGGFEVWQKNPVFGVGYGGFNEAFRETQSGREHAFFDPATAVRLPIHSLWLETLAETGIIGFVVYLSLMIIIFEKFWIAFRSARNPRIRLSLVALSASFLAILTGGIFYSYNLEFFWFFVFYFYFYCDITLKERKAESQELVAEEGEKVNWGEIWPIFLLSAVALPLLTYNLSNPLISSGQEGFFAVISKTIRRTGGMGWPFWWVPKFEEDYFFGRPPIFFYLNAFAVFLYDISTAAVRFWSSLFGFLSLVSLYLLVRLGFHSRKLALTAALVLMSFPLFSPMVRRGTLDSFVVFSSVTVGLACWFSRRNAFNYLFLGLWLAFVSVIDQKTFFVLGAILILAVLSDLFLTRRTHSYKSVWILTVPLLIITANWPWFSYAYKNFGQSFVDGYFSVGWRETLLIVLLLTLPWLSILLAKRLHQVRVTILLKLFVIVTLIQILIVPQSSHRSFIALINKRLEIDRRGTVPLVMSAPKSEDFLYYSEVPVIFISEADIDGYLLAERAYFLIMDGNSFRRRYKELISRRINARLVEASGSLVLVEKFGQVP